MYNYDLTISIFSNDENIMKIVNGIKPYEHFNHDVKSYNEIDKKVIDESDLVIYDLSISELKSILKDELKTKIIACVDTYDRSLENLDGIVVKPINYEFLEYVVKNVLRKISVSEELRYMEDCFKTAIDGIPDMFWVKSIDGIHTLVNKEFCNVVDKTREDVTGKDHYYIWNVSKDDPNSGADLCKKTEDEVIAAGEMLSFAESVKSKNGTRQLVTYKSPLYDKLGRVIGTVGFGHDITDLNNMSVENQIFLNSVPYAVLIRDNDGVVQNINNYFESYFGVTKDQIVGKVYKDWADNTFYPDRRINEGGFTEGTTCVNGEEKIFELRFENICDVFNNVTGQICMFRDVTVERKLEQQIIESSNVDFMTKLYNRRYLDNFISTQSNGTMLSLFAVDLDKFKLVNDTYGHKAGDEAIILTANTLMDCFKGDLVVRMGGDEFLIVKTGENTKEQAKKEAQNLLDKLKENYSNSEKFSILSASIGISQGILGDKEIDSLLVESDHALYESKAKGRNCYTYYN